VDEEGEEVVVSKAESSESQFTGAKIVFTNSKRLSGSSSGMAVKTDEECGGRGERGGGVEEEGEARV